MPSIRSSTQPAVTDEREESPEISLRTVERTEMPLPSDFGIFFQGGLFILAMFAALYVAREIILPIVLAFILMLVLYPAMRLLERLRVPRILGALLLISLLFGVFIGVGTVLVGPAASWATKLPLGVPRLQEHLSFLRGPVAAIQHLLQQAESYVSGDLPSTTASPSAAPAASGIWMTLFTGTRDIAAGLFETVLVLFFLLLAGDIFLRRLVEILPRFSDKRQAVDIAQQIERDISVYLVTITLMNAVVGTATAVVMWLCGLGDPLLWGAVAFLLNYVPILGPLLGVVTFALAGLLTSDTLWGALLPACLYLLIHLLEGETITPMLLARRFTLNPVLVVLSLIFWYWMWGVPGAILSIPMLAIIKIICDRVQTLAALGHFLEG